MNRNKFMQKVELSMADGNDLLLAISNVVQVNGLKKREINKLVDKRMKKTIWKIAVKKNLVS